MIAQQASPPCTLDDQRISDEARAIIRKNQQEAPVNVSDIARQFGLEVWLAPDMREGLSGAIIPSPEEEWGGSAGYAIFANKKEAQVRQRFTIAHEIAHFLLHRDKIVGDGLSDSALYRSGLSNREEVEANYVAADILMPFSLIDRLYEEGVTRLNDLARRLDVSEMALKIRLGIPT